MQRGMPVVFAYPLQIEPPHLSKLVFDREEPWNFSSESRITGRTCLDINYGHGFLYLAESMLLFGNRDDAGYELWNSKNGAGCQFLDGDLRDAIQTVFGTPDPFLVAITRLVGFSTQLAGAWGKGFFRCREASMVRLGYSSEMALQGYGAIAGSIAVCIRAVLFHRFWCQNCLAMGQHSVQ